MNIKPTRFDIRLEEKEIKEMENILEYALAKLRHEEEQTEQAEKSKCVCANLLSVIEGRYIR